MRSCASPTDCARTMSSKATRSRRSSPSTPTSPSAAVPSASLRRPSPDVGPTRAQEQDGRRLAWPWQPERQHDRPLPIRPVSAPDPTKIKTAIDALEAQRHVLGDDVVETALAPLRASLAAATGAPRVRRRQVTVMFADLSGFTTLSEYLDPEELALMLARFWRSVDDIITRYRGNVLQHMGDGVLAVWSDTTALEDDAQQAVTAALQIIERVERDGILVAGANVEATVSIGINTGPVHLRALDDFGYTTLGDTVNVAARLEAGAGAGEVWISRATYHQVRGVFDLEDVGDRHLKGRKEPVRAYRVLRARPNVRTGYLRGLDGTDTQLVGRAEEQTLLGLRLDALETAGTPSSMVLIGDPGIGKSRLLEFAMAAIGEHAVLAAAQRAGRPFRHSRHRRSGAGARQAHPGLPRHRGPPEHGDGEV